MHSASACHTQVILLCKDPKGHILASPSPGRLWAMPKEQIACVAPARKQPHNYSTAEAYWSNRRDWSPP